LARRSALDEVLLLSDAVPARFRVLIFTTALASLRFGEVTALRRCEAEASFTEGGAFGTQLDTSVVSFDMLDLKTNLSHLASQLSKCPAVTATDKSSEKSEIAISALSFPNLGDETLAMRLTIKTEGISGVADLIFVAQGHNGFSLLTAGLKPVEGPTLEKIARAGVSRLTRASES